MQKKVLILSTLGLLTSLMLVHGATISAPTMRMGAKGRDVVILQDFLIQNGYLTMPIGVSKGTYGSLTRDAVKKFQKDNKIEQTGNFGVKTKALYMSLSTGSTSTPTTPAVPKKSDDTSAKPSASCLTKTDGSVSCATAEDEDSCKAKGGIYNECGSLCDTSKEGACIGVCVKTCTTSPTKKESVVSVNVSSSTSATSSPVGREAEQTSIDTYTPATISTDRTLMCDDRPEGGSCKYLSEKGVTSGTCVAVKESLVCQ